MSAATSLPDPDLEALAEALALLRTAILIHDRARLDFDAATDALATAIVVAVDARETYTRVGGLVIETSRHLARLRDAR